MNRYKVLVKPISERISDIKLESANPLRKHRFYEFRESTEDLPVVRLPLNLPLYRVANYRTNLLQLKWIKDNQKPVDFFSKGEENESVQQIQHTFLWQFAQEEKESIASILERLKSEKQRDPILISAQGVVVNGNRRLAAMREIYMESPEIHSSFSHIDCMVLPEYATEDDLKDIEVRLQMTPETRLPYDWINECIAIRDLYSRGRSFDVISSMMRLDASKVKDRLLVLTEIDLYLKDWKNSEADYDLLNDAEEIFGQITTRLKKKEGIEQEVARRIGWILVDQRGKDGRVYDLREATGSLTQLVSAKLQEVYTSEIKAVEELASDDDLEFEFETPDVQDSNQSVIDFLNNCRDDQVQEDIVRLCRVVIEAQKAQKISTAALRAIKEAHTKLIEVDLTFADKATLLPIDKQLESIALRVNNLQVELKRYL